MTVNPEKERALKRARALELRMAGATYEEIAQVVGFRGKSGAYEAVQKALEERAEMPGPLHPAVALELARLDTLLTVFYPPARKGDVAAGRLCLRMGERRTHLILLHGRVAGAVADPDPTSSAPPEEVSGVVSILDRYASRGGPGAPAQ